MNIIEAANKNRNRKGIRIKGEIKIRDIYYDGSIASYEELAKNIGGLTIEEASSNDWELVYDEEEKISRKEQELIDIKTRDSKSETKCPMCMEELEPGQAIVDITHKLKQENTKLREEILDYQRIVRDQCKQKDPHYRIGEVKELIEKYIVEPAKEKQLFDRYNTLSQQRPMTPDERCRSIEDVAEALKRYEEAKKQHEEAMKEWKKTNGTTKTV